MSFVNGQPCWVDIMVKDAATQSAYTAFLTDLFGLRWEIGGPETGFYGMGFIGDGAVMAVGQQEHGAGHPSVYLKVDDIDATVAAVTAAGGNVFLPPMQVMEAGSLAMAMDPTGAVVGMWQPNLMRGFGSFNVPGAFTWFDLMTPDPLRAKDFYVAAFGLGFEEMGNGGILTKDGQWLASVSQAPEGQHPFWNPIFSVESVEASEARATQLGCTVLMSRMAVPGGLASAVMNPALGLTVTVFEASEPAPATA